MSDLSAENLARMEDDRAGRVVPRWRWWLAYSLIPVAWIIGQVDIKFDWPFWAGALTVVVLLEIYITLLVRYRRRTVI